MNSSPLLDIVLHKSHSISCLVVFKNAIRVVFFFYEVSPLFRTYCPLILITHATNYSKCKWFNFNIFSYYYRRTAYIPHSNFSTRFVTIILLLSDKYSLWWTLFTCFLILIFPIHVYYIIIFPLLLQCMLFGRYNFIMNFLVHSLSLSACLVQF